MKDTLDCQNSPIMQTAKETSNRQETRDRDDLCRRLSQTFHPAHLNWTPALEKHPVAASLYDNQRKGRLLARVEEQQAEAMVAATE